MEDESPFDREKFDPGIDVDEEDDPKNFIQKLSGKLGQSLRDYNEKLDEPDFKLEKFAINSVISATNTSQMPEDDVDDIIDKLETAGKDEVEKQPDDDFDGELESEDDFDEKPQSDGSIEDIEKQPNEKNEKINEKKLFFSENITNFVKETISENVEKMILDKKINEVMENILFNTEREVDAPTIKPGTKEEEKETPTRRERPWKTPKITENPDPKAKKHE